MNEKRGNRPRPCPRCGVEIRYETWREETLLRGKRVWHWVNVYGGHHYCIPGGGKRVRRLSRESKLGSCGGGPVSPGISIPKMEEKI